MAKKKQEKDLGDVLEEFYFFMKYKLHFNDFQASSVIISITLLPLSWLLGFNGTSSSLSRWFMTVFFAIVFIDVVCIIYSILMIKRNKDARDKSKSTIIKDIASIKTIEEVDLLSGMEFEKFIERIYMDKGYKTRITKASYDGGADILAEKGNDLICIQAKRRSKSINKYPVFDAFHAQKPYSANKACIATNRELTEQAKNFAHDLEVEIIDRYKIMAILRKRNDT